MLFELGNVDIFASDEEWAKLRRPSLIEFIQGRLGRLNDAMGDKQYLVDAFSVADIAMATVLRAGVEAGLIAEQPRLQAYLDRCLARHAFPPALDAHLARFRAHGRASCRERVCPYGQIPGVLLINKK